ncbi:hypothetical protein [Sphingopyxis sp. Geo48]|uniref:hypothetical protein n=1 Tax=Sphingopyxis sp. Geo48 TaxID=545241 RepID=UPI0024B6A77D|nr:hypothetical protein [Sphingopyxis sp. Geo48]
MDAETVAKGLSEAQKRYLREAVLKSPICGYDKRWMTFPPPNTHMVLRRLGLVDWGGQLSPDGLAVRALLLKDHDA